MSFLYRFDAEGFYLGAVADDQSADAYAARDDLTATPPPDPQDGFRCHWDGTAWTQMPETPAPVVLDDLKTEKWEEMKVARRAAICAPLPTPYGAFDADDEARNNIIQTAHLMQTQAQTLAPDQAPTVDFTLADNTVVTLTAGQMVQVALLLAQQIQQAYERGRAVRAAIEAAATPEDVLAVSWSPQ